jgi:hypothetical protein
MAKKRKRQEERKEEREYKPPEFDRLEYVKTEASVSKATILAAIFSIPMGLAAMFIMPVGGTAAGLMAGVAGIGILWFLLPLLRIDVKPFKPMQWAGVMSTYFLVFLTVWVVACNPPFNDIASPEIQKIQVSWGWGSSNVTASEMGSLEATIPANVTTITIRAQVTDNVKVDSSSVRITSGSSTIPMPQTSNPIIYEITYDYVDQFQNFKITAIDVNGNANEGLTFTIVHG